VELVAVADADETGLAAAVKRLGTLQGFRAGGGRELGDIDHRPRRSYLASGGRLGGTALTDFSLDLATANGPDCVKTGTYGIPSGLCIEHD